MVSGAKLGIDVLGRCPQEQKLVFHSLVIGHGTAWRPVKGPRHVMAEGELGGRAAAVWFVVGDAQAIRSA